MSETLELSEDGKKRRRTKRRWVVRQTVAKAIKGDTHAREMTMRYSDRIHESESRPKPLDEAMVDAWLRDRTALLAGETEQLGDPAPPEEDVVEPADDADVEEQE